MKDFYTDILGLEFVSEEKDRCVFLKAGQSMLLIFNPNKTLVSSENSTIQFPIHGAFAPPSIIHIALEVDKENYDNARHVNWKKIKIEKEITWEKGNSIYIRDPAGISLKSLLQVVGQ